MIIDDDYCQYDVFRLINKAGEDADKAFAIELEGIKAQEKAAKAQEWNRKAAFEKEHEESTEESVYALTFAQRMAQLWKRELKK